MRLLTAFLPLSGMLLACAQDVDGPPADVAGRESALMDEAGFDELANNPDYLPGRDHQGPLLLGTNDARLEHAFVRLDSAQWPSGSPKPKITGASVNESGLALVPSAPVEGVFLGAEGSEGFKPWFFVQGVGDHDDALRPLYRVRVHGGGASKPLCPDANLAYLLPSSFSPTGFYNSAQANRAAFACLGSAAAKSVAWGYGPWDGREDFFRASISMARAEYCADNKSYTIKGTEIGFTDRDSLQGEPTLTSTPTPPVDANGDPLLFEAAWFGGPAGATEFAPTGALCVSKMRWMAVPALPEESPCPVALPDPRVFNEFSRSTLCEHLVGTARGADALAKLSSLGAVTFSWSRANDRGLWAHGKNPSAPGGLSEYLTTTSGFWTDMHGTAEAPHDDSRYIDRGPLWLGAIFTQPHPQGGTPITVPLRVYRHYWSGRYLTTVQELKQAKVPAELLFKPWVLVDTAGHVYPKGPPPGHGEDDWPPKGASALITYLNSTTGDRVLLPAGLEESSVHVPAGYAPVTIEGYAFRSGWPIP
jgi:hypothetical protein